MMAGDGHSPGRRSQQQVMAFITLTFTLMEGLSFLMVNYVIDWLQKLPPIKMLKELMMINTVEVTLKGLSCGHCINRVKACLESLADVDRTNVTLTTARVTGNASPDVLIAAINAAGYEAVLSHPKANPRAESQPPPEALTAVQDMLRAIDADSTSQQLLINGMNCASCVMRVQQALSSVAGVTQANVNLAEHTALVMGSASSRDLVHAVEQVGYGAEAITDNNERRRRPLPQ